MKFSLLVHMEIYYCELYFGAYFVVSILVHSFKLVSVNDLYFGCSIFTVENPESLK